MGHLKAKPDDFATRNSEMLSKKHDTRSLPRFLHSHVTKRRSQAKVHHELPGKVDPGSSFGVLGLGVAKIFDDLCRSSQTKDQHEGLKPSVAICFRR